MISNMVLNFINTIFWFYIYIYARLGIHLSFHGQRIKNILFIFFPL